MKENFPNTKYTLENIPQDIATEVHKCLNALSDNTATDAQINWLIDTVEPKTIKDLSRLNTYLSESDVLEKLIEKKSLPPDLFN